jgi:hypothetical protein
MADVAPPAQQPFSSAVAKALAVTGNDPAKALEHVIRSGNALYKRFADLEAELARIRGQVPAEGSLVLSADQAKTWKAIEALNLNPEQITAAVSKLPELEKRVAEHDRAELVRKAAGLVGWKEEVLNDLVAAKALKIELKEVEKDGKKVQQAVVTQEGAEPTELSAYGDSHLAAYLPALKNDATEQPPRQPSGGHVFPQQRPADKAPPAKKLTPAELAQRKRARGIYSI